MWCNCSIHLSRELDHYVMTRTLKYLLPTASMAFRAWRKAGFSCFGSGVQCFFFPISWWNQGGEHPYADFDLIGDIISRTLKTVISRHKYGNTFPKKNPLSVTPFRRLFSKKGNLRQNIPRNLCRLLAMLAPQNISDGGPNVKCQSHCGREWGCRNRGPW
jgi:hypothetical protein